MIDPANKWGQINDKKNKEQTLLWFVVGDGGSTLCFPVESEKKKVKEKEIRRCASFFFCLCVSDDAGKSRMRNKEMSWGGGVRDGPLSLALQSGRTGRNP